MEDDDDKLDELLDMLEKCPSRVGLSEDLLKSMRAAVEADDGSFERIWSDSCCQKSCTSSFGYNNLFIIIIY